MVGWIVGKLKWLLVICAVGGPIVTLSCWHDGNRRREVMANGVETVAAIDNAKRVKRRRGGTTYKLDLSWRDAGGVEHRVEDVTISHEFARQIIVEDRLVAASLPIKYMRGGTGEGTLASENLIVLPDTAHQEQTDAELVYVGAGVGVVGVIGCALMFRPRRRRREPVPA
ncbi:hypothetical protein [Methylobacterium radiodurans]|uniref:DUF3592 domain-containing protein n=1 Tax=Methylobacterium radiodurans TaxID=2202828 RepID=A0A2U8VSY6_9HYPH|nr:hypothetical protein [Methylobacterium radiodurans]AWN36807.1 hypothetical protein DK427_14580 [Methylobacterium radiodurans]